MQKEYVLQFAKELLSIDSPTGYTQQAISFVEQEVQSMGYRLSLIHIFRLHFHTGKHVLST